MLREVNFPRSEMERELQWTKRMAQLSDVFFITPPLLHATRKFNEPRH